VFGSRVAGGKRSDAERGPRLPCMCTTKGGERVRDGGVWGEWRCLGNASVGGWVWDDGGRGRLNEERKTKEKRKEGTNEKTKRLGEGNGQDVRNRTTAKRRTRTHPLVVKAMDGLHPKAISARRAMYRSGYVVGPF
jgi:hypothetical protein